MKSRIWQVTLSEEETEVLKGFLKDLMDHLENAGCNDFDLLNTPGYVKLVKSAIRSQFSRKKDIEEELSHIDGQKSDKTIRTMDTLILGHLMKRMFDRPKKKQKVKAI